MRNIKKVFTKIPQYTRNKRHLQSFLKHGTLKKFFNFMCVEIERELRRIHLTGRPYLLIVDPCNFCNLSCPLCPTGMKELHRKQRLLTFEEFKHIFDKFSKYLFEVNLHNWGESFINNEIYKMIEYAQKNNVGTNLSSNFVSLTPSDIENIIDCGLEYIVVSLDATTPEVYETYRIGGNFHGVIENLNLLLKRRREKKSRTPVIEWQFIIMKNNQHQVAQADTMSKKLGIDMMRFIPVGLPFDSPLKKQLAEQWFPINMGKENASNRYGELQFGQGNRPGPCYYLYRSMVVNPDGGILPCCVVYNQAYDFGQIWDQNITNIWNNNFYIASRSLFSKNTIDVMNISVNTPCVKCNLFRKR